MRCSSSILLRQHRGVFCSVPSPLVAPVADGPSHDVSLDFAPLERV